MNFQGPESVQSLSAVTAEVNLTLTWSKPVGHKPGYSFRVTWTNSTGLIISNRTTAMENLPINGLVPGSLYNFTVTTQTDDGTEGAPVSTSSCTSKIIACFHMYKYCTTSVGCVKNAYRDL